VGVIACPLCGTKVDESVSRCPKCGCDPHLRGDEVRAGMQRDEEELEQASRKQAAVFTPESVLERARRARGEGRRFFQAAVPLSVTARGAAGFFVTKTETDDRIGADLELLETLEDEGWTLEHVGYVFEETGSISASRMRSLLPGEREAITGNIVGIYLFRARPET
jgi:hypothetical protein